MKRYVVSAFLIYAGLWLGCSRAGAPDASVAARVNGRDIPKSDVEREFNIRTQNPSQKPAGDAAGGLRLEILHDLIEAEIMDQRAAQLKVTASDAEVDAEVKRLQGSNSQDDFKKALAERGVGELDLRQQLRREINLKKLLENQIQSKIHITDADVSQFYQQNKEVFNVKEEQIRLAQIVVTSTPGSPVANSRNDKAGSEEQALQKVEMLSSFLQAGGDFGELASEYSEDPQTARSGGDLGYQPVSMLDHLSPAVKASVLKLKVGETAPVVRGTDSYLILKLLGKREPGQRDLSDAELKQGIHDELQNQRQRLLTTAFYEKIHNDARVENFLANDILAQAGTGK